MNSAPPANPPISSSPPTSPPQTSLKSPNHLQRPRSHQTGTTSLTVTATLVDADGTVIPDSTTLVHFSTTGPGKVIAVDNGNLLDHDPFQATERKLYEGHAIAILRATSSSGSITLTATAEGVPSATLTLRATTSKSEPVDRSF